MSEHRCASRGPSPGARGAAATWIAGTVLLVGAAAAAASPTGDARAVSASAPAASASAPATATGAGSPGAVPGGPAGQAVLAYAAMQRYLYNRRTHLYRGPHQSHVWGFSQALAATTSLWTLPAGVGPRYTPDLRDRVRFLEAYWDPGWDPAGYVANVAPPRGPGGHLFFDDNDWVGIELARLYRLAHQPHELRRAEQIFALSVAAWDDSQSLPCPGGVPFTDDDRFSDRNVVTNGPAAELALQLYRLTRKPAYLAWAQQMYAWVRSCLSLENGLYADHINAAGTVDPTVWTYTQGAMIGAGVMLFQATGDQAYLDQAQATARAASAYFDTPRLQREPRFFVTVYFRNLLALDSVRPDPAYRAVLQGYADWAWKAARQPQTNLFTFGARGTKLLDQASMVQIYAMLAGRADTLF